MFDSSHHTIPNGLCSVYPERHRVSPGHYSSQRTPISEQAVKVSLPLPREYLPHIFQGDGASETKHTPQGQRQNLDTTVNISLPHSLPASVPPSHPRAEIYYAKTMSKLVLCTQAVCHTTLAGNTRSVQALVGGPSAPPIHAQGDTRHLRSRVLPVH